VKLGADAKKIEGWMWIGMWFVRQGQDGLVRTIGEVVYIGFVRSKNL
jgi:hypothetical protein